jgi:hypothetical protein
MSVFVMLMAATAAFFMLAFPAPAFAAESVDVIAAALDVASVVVPSIVPIASLFVSLTKTPAPGTLWGRVYRVIEILALVFGRAKEAADAVAANKPGYEGHQLCSALDHECEAQKGG